MLAVISPAKSLDFQTKPTTRKATTPAFLDDASVLIDDLVKLEPGEVSDLMGISTKLGELNCNRYNEWRKETRGGKQAALAFTGDVYMGLGAWDLDARELTSLPAPGAHPFGTLWVAEADGQDPSVPAGDGHGIRQRTRARSVCVLG